MIFSTCFSNVFEESCWERFRLGLGIVLSEIWEALGSKNSEKVHFQKKLKNECIKSHATDPERSREIPRDPIIGPKKSQFSTPALPPPHRTPDTRD